MISTSELILKTYIQLAQDFTDAASPQDNFLAAISSDWRYERALQGVRLLAQHHVGQLVQTLIAWRQNVNEEIKKNFSVNNVVTLQGVCKRAAMEVLFLEASLQVLDEFVPEFWRDRHFQNFFESMQHVAFRWLLNSEEYVPHPELSLVRQHVVFVSSRLVGVMSRIRLSEVCSTFVKKLEERVNSRKDGGPRTDAALLRSQALKLCAGMKGVVLRFDDDAQLEQAIRFLQRLHPLNYTAPVKKSQIHHAMCEMLTDILAPLVRSNEPQGASGLSAGLMTEWYTLVLRLKNEIGQWVNKHSKHITVGYPLVTVLVCLVDPANYLPLVDSMTDFLAKQMKVKDYRSLCFRCLNQLVTSSLVRHKAAHPGALAWLDKSVKQVLANARKGGIPTAEQQEFVSDVADLSPEYCVGSIITDLLQSDSPDAQLIALRALHLVATSVPGNTSAALEQRASTPRRSMALAPGSSSNSAAGGGSSSSKRMVQLPAAQVLDLIRAGQHPFELQGVAHLLPRVQPLLAQLLAQQHRSFGAFLSFAAEAVPNKEKQQQQLVIFSSIVRLVPYLRPEQWPGMRPLDLLPAYTAHAEGAVRASACDALMGTMRGCGLLRGTVLSNMAAFISSVPDDAVQTIRECLLLLRNLMALWLSLLQEQLLSSSSLNPGAAAASEAASNGSSSQLDPAAATAAAAGGGGIRDGSSYALDLHRMEGTLFMLLCSCSEAVRCDAYSALALLRTLHQELCIMAEQQGLGALPDTLQQQQQQQQGVPKVGSSWSAGATVAAAAGAGGSSFSSNSSAVADSAGVSASLSSLGVAQGAAGSGIFSRHKPTMSRDSAEFMLTLGRLEMPDAGVTCIMDVLEQVGGDVARRCFWDFGDWSDLWRETKHVPLDVSLQSLMAAGDEVGRLRWLRCIVELARAACHMCPTSMGVAYLDMLSKLARYVSRDSAGRLLLPGDAQEGRRSEAWKAFVVAACVCPPSLRERVEKAAARKGAGLTARELIRALLASLTGGAAIPQQVFLMALGHCSPEHYPVLFDELPGLMEEYLRPGRQRRGTARPEEVRKLVANVLRLVADAMPQGTLSSQPLIRARFLDWLRDTIQYLRTLPPFGEAFWEVSQVAYCLCAICRCVAGELGAAMTLPLAQLRDSPPMQRAASNKSTASDLSSAAAAAAAAVGAGAAAGGQKAGAGEGGVAGGGTGGAPGPGQSQEPMTRKLLFYMFAAWCEEGKEPAAEYTNRLNSGMNAALAQVKDFDADTRENLRQDLSQAAELLDQAARMAMAAMLQGPVFDTDARRAEGPVLKWINRMMTSPPLGVATGALPAVPRDSIARTGLYHLLRSNLDMFSVCVDRCYHADTRIATGTFQVVTEVYALAPVKVEPHVVLSLVLYKMVDGSQEVREDALHMLQVLSTREWQAPAAELASAAAAAAGAAAGAAWARQERRQQEEAFVLEAEGGSGTVVVQGALQDSYQQFQFELSIKLARDHPELSEALCEEMMTRQLEVADKVSQHPVLNCLWPWMENLTIAHHWKGTWCERLLKSMYYVTLRHGDELPMEIEQLWGTLARKSRNIVPVLDFLLSLGTHTAYQELNSMLEYLAVSRRICLYLARQNALQTIDHLVCEISLQIHEEEGGASAGGTGKLSLGQQHHASPPLQFASVLLADTAAARYYSVAGADLPVLCCDPSAAAAGSSAAAWWAHGGPSSLQASGMMPGFAGQGGPGSSSTAGAGGGLLAGMAGLLGSSGGVAASFPPSAAAAGAGGGPGGAGASSMSLMSASFASQVSSSLASEPSAVSRGMRLSSTFTSALGIGGGGGSTSSSLPAPPAGQDGSAALMRRSVTEHSDSSRSSLSVTEPSAQAGSMAGPGYGSLSASASSLSTAAALGGMPRPINTRSAAAGAAGGAAGAASGADFAAAGNSSSSGTFDLGSYYAVAPAPAGAAGAGDGGGGGAGVESWQAPVASGRRGDGGRATREPSSPVLRGLVTRPELALCLVTEVAYEHDEDFQGHLGLLCHVALLMVDHEEPLVAAAAQQLLINCLYSQSAHFLKRAEEEGQAGDILQATHLIKYLQSTKGRRLWAYEDLCLHAQQELPSGTALSGMVQHLLDALAFDGDVGPAWWGQALQWAMYARNRHLACRSLQVLRALRPPLTSDMCGKLLLCLQQCMAAAPGSPAAREVALELLLSLRCLLEVLPARKLLLYPQLFWSSLMLLFTSYVHIYQQALLMLSSCLEQLPLHDSTTQNVLLAAAPAASPADLQLLLSRSHVTACCLGGSSTNARAVSPDVAAAAGGSGSRGTDTWSRSRHGSAAAASAGMTTGSSRAHGSPAAVSGGAAGGASSLASSITSFVGGADAAEAACPPSPAPWAVGQLLPWPERGADGPAHHMIAAQQVLFKGLLFPDTQLQTVRLISLLAGGLASQPQALPAPAQAPLGLAEAAAAGVRVSSSGQLAAGAGWGVQAAWQEAGSGGRSGSRAGTGSRRSGTPSGHRAPASSSSARVAAASTPQRGGGGSSRQESPAGASRSSARFGAASLQQDELRAEQEQYPPGGASGSLADAAAAAAALSRSAPDLRALASGSTHAAHMHSSSAIGADVSAAADARRTSPAAAPSSSKRAAAAAAAGWPPPTPGVRSSSGWLLSSGPAGGSLGRSSSSSSRRVPGSRAVFQSLLGHRHSQLLVSIACVVPLFCSQLGQLEPDSELLAALQECMLTLAAACCCQGFQELGGKLQQFTSSLNINSSSSRRQQQQQLDGASLLLLHGAAQRPQPAAAGCSSSSSIWLAGPCSPSNAALVRLLQGLCVQLSRALLPTYADWLLRFWMGVLLLPGAAALHPAVLLLLRCLFDTPGLQLGPAGVALVLDSSFVSPVVTLSQGPLCQYALDALDSILHYAATAPEVQQYQQQQQQQSGASTAASAATSAAGMAPLSAGAAGGGGSSSPSGPVGSGGSGVDLQGLAACLLPQLDVVELLQRLLNSFGCGQRKRKWRLMPFLGEGCAAGGHTGPDRLSDD